MKLRQLLVCAALLCVAAARAFGQGDEGPEGATPPFVRLGDAGAEAARLLESRENRERAWGAYLVGLHGLKGQTASLVSLLEDESLAGGGPVESCVRQAALDALIRLDAEVPAETLLPLYQSAPAEVLILLARSPEKNRQALLALFADDAPYVNWLAAGNLLAAARAPGFAARLLAGLKIEARVYVYDYEGEHDYNGGWGGGCGGGAGGVRDPSLPPVGYYHLTAEARRGAAVVAPGRRNVYYERTPWAAYFAGCSQHQERDRVRVEYLAGMLGMSEDELELKARPFREVVCKDAPQCRRAVAAVRDDIRRSYASAVARLLERGLLDGAEAAEASAPDLTLTLADQRERKTFPLPDRLRGVKIVVEGADDGPAYRTDEPPDTSPDTPPAR